MNGPNSRSPEISQLPELESRDLLASIVESSDDAIISKTLEGRILSWNKGAERLFGFRAYEAVGAPMTIIIPRERHAEEEMFLERLRRGESTENYETIRVSKDGRLLDISVTISPIRDTSGRIVGASNISRDITARKQTQCELEAARRKLEAADRRKDEFLATLAHELRNPLAPIASSVQILLMSEDIEPATARLYEIIDRQVKHMARLVEDLLDACRITQGKIELRKERVDLAGIVASAVETSRPAIEAAGHQLAISLSPEPITLQADPVRLAQVISNLLTNAAKFTQRGGQIWLTVCRQDDVAVIAVRDTGIGIPCDMLGRVFEMFAQANRSVSQGGLGIGLSLAKRFVELHGGCIEAQSDGPDRGSEFLIRLPLDPALQRVEQKPSIRSIARRIVPVRRVLVVDDTRAAVYTLGTLLEKLGQHVFTTDNPALALEMARAEKPDVIISDIGMPEMDGYELARRLRQEKALDATVLVALTGFGQIEDRKQVREAGFDFHLTKPVGVEALLELFASLPTPRQADDQTGPSATAAPREFPHARVTTERRL